MSSPASRYRIAYSRSSVCHASRAITQAVWASMPGPNSRASRRACHVVHGASTQRRSVSRTWLVLTAVLSTGAVSSCGDGPAPSGVSDVVSVTPRVLWRIRPLRSRSDQPGDHRKELQRSLQLTSKGSRRLSGELRSSHGRLALFSLGLRLLRLRYRDQ